MQSLQAKEKHLDCGFLLHAVAWAPHKLQYHTFRFPHRVTEYQADFNCMSPLLQGYVNRSADRVCWG